MIILTVETEHFTFEGCGQTYRSAKQALTEGLEKHGKLNGLPPLWWHNHYDISERRLFPGECYRHDHLLYRKSK